MWLFLWDSQPSKIFVGDTAISKVFLWDTKIRPSHTPTPWYPWANTIAYYKFNWNLNDELWNYNWSWAWTSAYYNISANKQAIELGRINTGNISTPLNIAPNTVLFYMRWIDLNATSQDRRQLIWQTTDFEQNWRNFRAIPTQYNSTTILWNWFLPSTNYKYTNTSIVDTNWHLFTITNWDNSVKLYCDWVLLNTVSWSLSATSWLAIWWNGGWWYRANIYMADLILESKVRTDQEILDYYNQTKANYWL